MHVREWGKRGRPAVICLHGQIIDGEMFGPLARLLAADHQVFAPDLPGNGRSALPGGYSLEKLYQDLEALVPAGTPVSLVGFSLGGYHAFSLALRGKLKVERLGLLAPVLGVPPEAHEQIQGMIAAARGGADLAPAFVDRGVSGKFAAAHPETLKSVLLDARVRSWNTVAWEFEQMLGAPVLFGEAKKLTAKTLVRVGNDDVSVPPDAIGQVFGGVPGVEVQRVAGVGHLLWLEDAAESNEALLRFLRG